MNVRPKIRHLTQSLMAEGSFIGKSTKMLNGCYRKELSKPDICYLVQPCIWHRRVKLIDVTHHSKLSI
jgi:hypothetical protein